MNLASYPWYGFRCRTRAARGMTTEEAIVTSTSSPDPNAPQPVLPESGIWRVLWHRYTGLRWSGRWDQWLVRRVAFSPITWLYTKSSGNEPLPVLLLETIGRRTAQLRESVLPYWEVDGNLVVLGTKGGGPADPWWVENLRANPQCWAWVGRRRVPLRGRVADETERAKLADAGVWHQWLPGYQHRARSFGREVPFVVLAPGGPDGSSTR